MTLIYLLFLCLHTLCVWNMTSEFTLLIHCLKGEHIQLRLNISLKPSLTLMPLLLHSNLILKAKKCWNWLGVPLACHHQICAVNKAVLNSQSTGPTTRDSLQPKFQFRFIVALQLSFIELQFHAKSMSNCGVVSKECYVSVLFQVSDLDLEDTGALPVSLNKWI